MEVPEIINNIYGIFQEYYGEDKVDLQVAQPKGHYETSQRDCAWCIIVYWPEVTVTNEFDESVDIWKLYCKVFIKFNGKLCGKPLFARSEYNAVQWKDNYVHSHICGINKIHLDEFTDSCLGRGPINDTIGSLRYYVDLDRWRLYAWELDKYVHVESVAGVPYHRLAQLGRGNGTTYKTLETITELGVSSNNRDKYYNLISLFTSHLIKNNLLKFSYRDGIYCNGLPFVDTVLTISNAFIEWYNSNDTIRTFVNINEIHNMNMIQKVLIDSISIHTIGSGSYEDTVIDSSLGKHVVTFKGKDITLTKRESPETPNVEYTILNLEIISYILYKVTRYLNSNYGKSNNISTKTRIL